MFENTLNNTPIPDRFKQLLTGCAMAFLIGMAARAESPVRDDPLREIRFDLPIGSLNPYDPAEVAAEARFVAPSGRTIRVPAFYMEGWDPILNGPAGGSGWRVRFTPGESGRYEGRLYVSRFGGPFEPLTDVGFDSLDPAPDAAVRRDGKRLLDSDGNSFFAYGANLCWGDVRDLPAYLALMREAAQDDLNCIRVWLAPWWLPIERTAGRYDQNACARLDRIVQEADALGLRIILCIEQHGNLEPEGAPVGLWPFHPYNTAMGGPCKAPREFFTDPIARRLFRDRLRYIVARWGYSRSIMARELFNEVELAPLAGEPDEIMALLADWHAEMAAFLRETDPDGRLIATSSDIPLQLHLAAEGNLDLIQLHLYDPEDPAKRIRESAPGVVEQANVPVLIGEFGGTAPLDPATTEKGIVASAKAGASGALPWIQDAADRSACLRAVRSARRRIESPPAETGIVPSPK
jgi:hypothetical protein